MLARDLQSIVLYDQEGKFVGVRRPNSKLPIYIDGIKIVIVDAIGSSGLDLKVQSISLFALVFFLACFSSSFGYLYNIRLPFCPFRLIQECRLFILVLEF